MKYICRCRQTDSLAQRQSETEHAAQRDLSLGRTAALHRLVISSPYNEATVYLTHQLVIRCIRAGQHSNDAVLQSSTISIREAQLEKSDSRGSTDRDPFYENKQSEVSVLLFDRNVNHVIA